MSKRVFLIHGWEGYPENCWFPWLRKELENRGFQVFVPAMPNPEEPEIESWVNKLNNITKKLDDDTYFVGHSIGCQAIMRYLQTINNNVGGIIFVAGWFNLPCLETKEEKRIAKPWLEMPIDTERIKKLSKNIIAIFSDDDPDVPLSDSELFKSRLNAKIIIEHNKGHFSDDAGVKELPIVLKELLRISK